METVNFSNAVIEAYLALLKNLSQEDKLELISKLSQSMKKKELEKNELSELFGAFRSEKTAEQQIEEIRQARVFNRLTEEI